MARDFSSDLSRVLNYYQLVGINTSNTGDRIDGLMEEKRHENSTITLQ